MKALGEAAVDLPWILPCASSLVGLTRPEAASVWSEVRFDPGCVLLLVRASESSSLQEQLNQPAVLEKAVTWLDLSSDHFVDWNQPGVSFVQQICSQQALLAQNIAVKIHASSERAFVCGLLAPLGWLALSATHPEAIPEFVRQARPGNTWQQKEWKLDHTAIARRLARLWRLPPWMATVLGNLGLNVNIVEKLGADPVLFRVTQLAVALLQRQLGGLHLAIGDDIESLRLALGITSQELEELTEVLPTAPSRTWDPPARHPFLKDLLRLALDNRKQTESAFVDRLQGELDQLQKALEEHCHSEKERLQAMKLSSLAELAAGAGHEINNPLAVISGQAQYLLKQLQLAEETLSEETSTIALLESLKAKLNRPLQTIINQTQRIHLVLTDLMQFARPPVPHRQLIPAGVLLHEVSESLQEIALQKKVRLVCSETPGHWGLNVDVAQVRTALGGMLRNAIEAAPPEEGWAGMRVENGDGTLKLIVEDNGPGPAPGGLEHLFDPFYSGRSAGRGRGFGLSSAWRLARQQGGEVRFEGRHHDLTRFVLTLPAADMSTAPLFTPSKGNGQASENNSRNGSPLVA
jgi:two-component system NtrC family sensor kinase